jgi:excinuclease UvrABC helicase subunit UvrB
MLTGELHDEHQAVVDPIRNVLQEDVEVTELRDYDSMIGYTDEIIVSSTISVYPVPNPAEVLSSSVHMNRPVTRGNVS